MTEFRIIFDMDEVITQFLKKLLSVYNERYNTNLMINDIFNWQFTDDFHKIFQEKGFFEDLEPYPKAIETIQDLKEDGFDIIIATDAGGDPEIAYSKLKWIDEYMPFINRQKEVIITGSKHLINADLIIDDSPIHLESFPLLKIAIDRPYNRKVQEKCFRIYNNNFDALRQLIYTLRR